MKKLLALGMCLALMLCVGCSTADNNSSDFEWVLEEVEQVKENSDKDTTSDNSSKNDSNSKNESTSKNTSTDNKTSKDQSSSNATTEYITSKGDYGAGLKMKKLKNATITVQGTPASLKALQKNDKVGAPYTSYQRGLTWKQTYGVDIKYVAMDEADLVAAYASDNMPDIINVPFSNMSLAMDLSKVIDFDDELYTKEFNEYIEWTGKKYNAVGTKRLQRKYIIFNETAFKEAGEKTPLEWYNEGKWTFTQFRKTAKAMTDIDNDVYGITGNEFNAKLIPYSVVTWDKNGKISLNLKNTKHITALTELTNMYKIDNVVRTGTKMQNWRNEFFKSKDAMVIGNEYEFSELCYKSKMNGGVDIGVAPMFTWDITGEKKTYYVTSYMASSISAKPKNLEAAIEYIRLNAYVNQQMIERLGLFGSAEQYLTKAERAALVKEEKAALVINPVYDITADSATIIGKAQTLAREKGEAGISAQYDSIEPKLKQSVKEYNSKIK